jgi:formylglycine-generating enzyme required for sulfatase activity
MFKWRAAYFRTILAVAATLAFARAWAQQSPFTNDIGMEFIPIPAGEFDMGRAHVKISKPFYLGKYEVTEEQWIKVMYLNPSYFNEAWYPADWQQRPVEQVSWLDAQKFAERLSVRDKGYRYRLPTEAEWEYAARAGRSDTANEAGWSAANSGGATHPVGKQPPNAWGLYDMLGNVWEWCQDWYTRSPGTQSTAADPAGASSRRYRVVRGSSWCDNYMSSSYRSDYEPEHRDSCGGIRLAAERTAP